MLRRKLTVLREHCVEIGRPYEEIEKTAIIRLDLTRTGGGRSISPGEAVDRAGKLAELGIDHLIVNLVRVHEPGNIDLLGGVASEVQSGARPGADSRPTARPR
jgi:hypothetical protein